MTQPLRYSDLKPVDVYWLRIEAALESAYPVEAEALGKRRPSVILAGYAAWQANQQRAA